MIVTAKSETENENASQQQTLIGWEMQEQCDADSGVITSK
jgi:hypothetical protein